MRRFNLFVLTLVCLSALAAFSGGIQSGVDSLHRWKNLSDVPSPSTARTNLEVYSKDESDALAAQSTLRYYWTEEDDAASPSYEIMATGPVAVQASEAITLDTSIALLDQWLSPAGTPNLDMLVSGIYEAQGYISKSGAGSAYLTMELLTFGVDGTETLIASSSTMTFNGTLTQQRGIFTFSVPSAVTINKTDRLLVKMWGYRSGVAALVFWYGGVTDGYFGVPISPRNFLRTDGSNPNTAATVRDNLSVPSHAQSVATMTAHELDSSTHNCGTVASLGANIFAEDQKIGPNATLSLKYDASDSNRSTLGWSHIQLGNNALNRIIGGRTNAGGGLSFYVNSTLDYTYDTIDGSEAMRIDSDADVDINYNLFVAGNVQGASQVASETALSDHNLAVAVHGVTVVASETRVADHELDSSTHNATVLASETHVADAVSAHDITQDAHGCTVVASETRIADHELDSSTHNCGTIASLGANVFAENQALNGNWLSGDGGDEGVYVDGSGNVAVATTTPNARVTVVGTSGSPNYGIIWGSQSGGFTPGSPFQFVTTSYSDTNPIFLFYDQTSGQVAGQDLLVVRNSSGTNVLVTEQSGFVGVGTNTPDTHLTVAGNASMSGSLAVNTVPEYADNAAAIAGGLKVGQFYRTADALKVVHH